LVRTIAGWQPEKGHETLYVVRERMRKRVWCAAPLLSSATPEVRRLIVMARQWAERLDKPVRGWMSEKQEACVKAIASECPGTPHRSCSHPFLRDVAQPVLEMDRRAQVKLRRKVRGVRAIARRVLADHRPAATPEPTPPDERSKPAVAPLAAASEAAAPWASSDLGLPATDSALEAPGGATTGAVLVADEGGEVVLGDGAAVRGMLHDSQGGPLHPPG